MANFNPKVPVSGDTLRYIVDNVFLPARVPDGEESDIPTKDSALIKQVSNAATNFQRVLCEEPDLTAETKRAWDIVCRMLNRMHAVSQSGRLTKAGVEAGLQSMEVGDVLPIYLSGQNAGIIFRKYSAEEMTVESFEVSLPNEVVTGTIGKVVVHYPANPRIIIPANDELLSTLANAISFFSLPLGEVLPVITKAGAAHQNVRDTASPRYITEALAGFLRGIGRTSDANKEGDETVFIQKRIDDRVVFGSGKGQPWRRSSMWLLLRVSLQTTLEELKMIGGAGYKVFQAFLMAYLLYKHMINSNIVPGDVLDAMNRKLARRMWKLKEFVNAGPSSTLRFTSLVISSIAETLKMRWDKVRKERVNTVNWIAPTQSAIEASLSLSLRTSQKYLQSVVKRTRLLAQSVNQYDDAATTRALVAKCSTRLNIHSSRLPSGINTTELDIGLMDFECWVEKRLPAWSQSNSRSPEIDCVSLSSILETYAQYGSNRYAKIPERFSVYWLTLVELWVALDKLVIKWNILLCDYYPEIPHDFLDPLLLPSASQLKRLHAVQSYICQRRKAARRGWSLFEEISSPQSFQNVYFAQSRKMQDEKRQIEQWGREQRERTLQAMRTANTKYENLMAEAGGLSCEYYTYKTEYGDEMERHSSSCRKCFLQSQANRITTPRCEDPLPSNADQANSLVFELNCPKPFGLWRDVTYQMLLRAFAHSSSSSDKMYRLKDYIPTKQFYHENDCKISIDSSTVSIANSFHGNACRVPTTFDNVVFPHGGIYRLSYGGGWLQTRGKSVLRQGCTLPLDKPYNALGHFMENTTHSPNSVIASQAKCPVSMNLGEYLAFGHLRSGNEIQLRNIMRAVISDSLSLNEPGVHSLLMQTIWQAGPNEIAKMWCRDAHQDLSDQQFAEDMLVVLNESLEKVGDSGREILHLATLTALATRLLSLTDDAKTQEGCLSFLEVARKRASDWMGPAEKEIANATRDSTRLQHRIALIAMVWRLTFDVDANVLERLCSSPTNITTLLFAKMAIAADSTQIDSISSGIQLLLRRERHLARRLEPYIAAALERACEPLHEATLRIWGGYHRGSQWTALPSNASRWWKCVTSRSGPLESRSVCVNILSGGMLVDGKTPERLPSSYIAHSTYKCLFGKSVALRSRLSTMRGMEYEVTYKGTQLHFAMLGESLIVRRLQEGIVEEFIPPKRLREDVPSFFLHEQLHWYMEEGRRRIIEFRPTKAWWISNTPKAWILSLKKSGTADLRGTLWSNSSLEIQRAMDPHSEVFKQLHHAVEGVERLPLSMYVVATTSSDDPQSCVLNLTLPNHNLDFFVNQEGHLEARSFPDYIMDSNQDIECLYGLRDCLVLCDKSSSQRFRKVVVPRGRIEAVGLTNSHPTVHIRAAEKAGFHSYEVDTLVGRLVGNGTMDSDLFLIQLHAYTSSHYPDPLTNRTGTEQALESLESNSLLSHYVPSASWRDQLDQIAAISPRRGYYPHWGRVMEQVEWNNNLSTASQHPGFETRVTNILSYWADLDLSGDSQNHTQPSKSASGMVELSRRAALRDLRNISSHSPLKLHHQDDHKHTFRDVLLSPESRKREALAYQVAFCTHHRRAGLPVCSTLVQTAKSWNRIERNGAWGWSDFPKWFAGSIPSLWSTLYELSCVASLDRESPHFDIAMVLSVMAYRGTVPFSILGTLVTIIHDAQFGESAFNHTLPCDLQLDLGSLFKDSEIRNRVESKQIGFSNSEESHLASNPVASYSERLRRRKAVYEAAVSQEVNQVVDAVKQWWLDTQSHHLTITVPRQPHLRLDTLISDTIRPRLEIWLRNKRFLEHLATVDRRILQAPRPVLLLAEYQLKSRFLRRSHSHITDVRIEDLMKERDPRRPEIRVSRMPTSSAQQPTSIHGLRVLKLKSLVDRLGSVLHGRIEEQYRADLVRSMEAFSSSRSVTEAQISTQDALFARRHSEEQSYDAMHARIGQTLGPKLPAERLLAEAGLWPRVIPQTLLSRLSLQCRSDTPEKWIVAISFYANRIIAVQRSRRLLHYGTRGMITEYNREMLHGREREPLGHPDSLLVEIDADICVRSDQMNIANAMIGPSGGKNTVMQLNMGEGKSSVIVPIVAAALANTDQLVRVVVLKPQSKLQLSLLRGRLSKLANRRIICLPFNRELKVDLAIALKISYILENCRADGAIWLCQPEHILSFKLLGLDLTMRSPESLKVGIELINCQLWMQENIRDILDESDEILHTRHQLVYTVGSQANFDAAPARWEVVQQLLALMRSYLSDHPSPHFSISSSSSPGQFPSIEMKYDEGRGLFDELAANIINQAVIPSIRMANLPTSLKKAALRLLTECQIPPYDPEVRSLELYCQENDEKSMWQSLLIVRGLIAFNILPHNLRNKRWRVDYGHDLRRSQLAVPYRAKDSPSLRSDFAHPDVLVLLTCLTYYYSGLDDPMIVRAVKELLKLDNPELIYEQWIAPCRDQVPVALHKFAGVNVDDDKMIVQSLRPFIHRNKLAIDFFLNRCVFPKEAKEFPYKMSTSGWDLAMEKTNPTTGFSGTNDSRFLLPTSIVQADSSAQRHTNATVLAHILQDENATVVPHANNLTSEQILDTIFALDPQPTVLLDVGAQILDCSNEDLVRLWLSMYDEGGAIKAAVFFDNDDNMCIMEYDGTIQAFADSPYTTRLNECLVYLDDSHTRGTDLKLPACRAAVTLGPRLPKDKLVQGCMRMRKLGSQHSLVFLAPIDVVAEVKKAIGDDNATVESSHVLIWTMKETCRQLQVNVANWEMQGYEFVARQTSWGHISTGVRITAQQMQDLFCQKESRSLAQLYGIKERKSARERAGHTVPSINENPMLRAIEEHCKLFDMSSFDDARTQEEQEVELVHEQEVEREVERPHLATPAPNSVHADVKHLVKTGILLPDSPAFRTVKRSFEHTSLVFPAGGTSAFSSLMVTNDFYDTIQRVRFGSISRIDDFLRPVEWIVTSQVQEPLLVAFSPHEVNKLLPLFRTSTKAKLHLFAPRASLGMRSLDDLLLFTLPTNIPRSPIISSLAQQLNLYSGTLYLRDIQSYHGLCRALRLHFGDLAPEIADLGVINSNGFVKDRRARNALGLVGEGFKEDPVQFLGKLFHLRRNGRSFLPSHMGQILSGVGLTESTFKQDTVE